MQDAAELYERAGLHEKAAAIYIQAKAFALAAPLMALIPYNPKLQLKYAKAKEGAPCITLQLPDCPALELSHPSCMKDIECVAHKAAWYGLWFTAADIAQTACCVTPNAYIDHSKADK